MVFALKLIEVPEGTSTDLIGKIIKLKKLPSTLGRGKDATIVVRHRKLSRLHCRLFLTNDQLCVRDLGSTNGTTINGVLVSGMQTLRMGDLISAGGVVFQVGQIVLPGEPLRGESLRGEPLRGGETLAATDSSPVSESTRPIVTSKTKDGSGMAADDSGQFEAATDSCVPVPANLDSETIDWKPVPDATTPQREADNNLVIELAGIPHVQPISSVQIESSFVDKASDVDPQALPHLSDVTGDLDPEEVDLSAFAEQRKGASYTALGNFFEQKDPGKKR